MYMYVRPSVRLRANVLWDSTKQSNRPERGERLYVPCVYSYERESLRRIRIQTMSPLREIFFIFFLFFFSFDFFLFSLSLSLSLFRDFRTASFFFDEISVPPFLRLFLFFPNEKEKKRKENCTSFGTVSRRILKRDSRGQDLRIAASSW